MRLNKREMLQLEKERAALIKWRANRTPEQKEALKKRDRERARTPERKAYVLMRNYGITQDRWLEIFVSQGSRCGICKRRKPKGKKGWHTDHDHKTHKVRGILCEHCNKGLGMFQDKVKIIEAAIEYLNCNN